LRTPSAFSSNTRIPASAPVTPWLRRKASWPASAMPSARQRH